MITTLTGMVLFLFMGLINAWSILVAPLETEFGWTRAQTSLIFTLSITFFCLGGLVSAFFAKAAEVTIDCSFLWDLVLQAIHMAAPHHSVQHMFVESLEKNTLPGILVL